MENKDFESLRYAVILLEKDDLVAKMDRAIGGNIKKGLEYLPKSWNNTVGFITTKSLNRAMEAALFTMDGRPSTKSSNGLHKLAVAFSGAVGGVFGIGSIAIELPISTTIMLRSIADIARSEGEQIGNYDTKLACLEVFAMGGHQDGALQSNYYSIRGALSGAVSEAARYLARGGLIGKGEGPIIIKFISRIAERFGTQVSEKAAAIAVPVIGAATGAAINTLFIHHFQNKAHGHFIVRRLESRYGKNEVRQIYETLSDI